MTPTRRRVHPLPLTVLAILLAGACSTQGIGNKKDLTSKPRPNIIFILADDLGYGDLGVYGQQTITTPHIDGMAREGLRFTQAYSGSPVCAPSRSVLMTGQHAGHTRIRDNRAWKNDEPYFVHLQLEDTTVAEVVKKAGYATGIAGKWGLGQADSTGTPLNKGFDEWLGYLDQANAHSYW